MAQLLWKFQRSYCDQRRTSCDALPARAPIQAEGVRVDQRGRRLLEGHVRVKEDGARPREGLCCGVAQAL